MFPLSFKIIKRNELRMYFVEPFKNKRQFFFNRFLELSKPHNFSRSILNDLNLVNQKDMII